MTVRSLGVFGSSAALGLMGMALSPGGAAAGPILGLADPYAVLGGTGVHVSGAGATINGNLGAANSAVTGPMTFTAGSVDNVDAASALGAANAAAIFLGGFGSATDKTGVDLGGSGAGLTLFAGVYNFTSTATLNGTLTLDAQGNDNAVFIFEMASDLVTGTGAKVSLINGGPNDGVFWLIGTQATLGPSTVFEGNIIAGTEVVLDDSAQIQCGRAIANTQVTMSGGSPTNLVAINGIPAGCAGGLEGGFDLTGTAYSRVAEGAFVEVPEGGGISAPSGPVSVPEPSTLALFGCALVGFLGFATQRRRVRSA